MIHDRYIVVTLPGSPANHVVEGRLKGKTDEEVRELLVHMDTLCEFPCPLTTIATEAGDGAKFCPACAAKAQQKGLFEE